MWDTSRQHEHLQDGFVTSNSSLTLDIIVLYWNYLGNTDTSQVRQVVEQYLLAKTIGIRDAAIAQWIRLHLPSRHPGFESQAHQLCFYIYNICAILSCEKIENKQKGRVWPMF